MAGTPAPTDPHAALALYAGVLGASSLPVAAHRLAGALAQQLACTRVTVALHVDGRTRVLAGTDLDLSNRQAELPQALLGAIEEAIEQRAVLAWPRAPAPPDDGEDAIAMEHQALHRLVGAAVATVPLGDAGEVFAAVSVERGGAPFAADELLRLEQLLVLAAPALRWMQQAGQPWYRRMFFDAAEAGNALRQPRRRGLRRSLTAAALVLLFVAVVPLEDEVGGRARIEGVQQRVVFAPTDGFVKTAHVRPGDRVRAGDPLVDLIEADLQLERGRWASQLEQHENAYAAAMSKSDRVGASTSMARMGEAQAQLALVEEQLARGRIVAPFDAVVIQGDLSQSAGAPVRQGDNLLTLASTAGYRVIVEIDETDIARVRQGQTGRMQLSSLPWGGQDLLVERISPLSHATEGRNVFEVEARLPAAPAELRPGLIGRAGIVVGRLPPLWAWSRHALDRARLAWWAWLG